MKALTKHSGEHETLPVQHNHAHDDHNHRNVVKNKPPDAFETRQNAVEDSKIASDKQNLIGKLPEALEINLPKRKKREITSEEFIHQPKQHAHKSGDDHGHKGSDVHSAVGLALVAGFVLMLLVDQLAQHRSISGKQERCSNSC